MTSPHYLHGPVELADGSVVVPAHLAAAVRRVLVRDLAQHVRADGGAPTAGVRQLLYAIGRAEQHHDQAAAGSADGTSPAVPVIVEISTDTAALALGCSVEYVRRLCRSGRILGRRIGKAWLIDRASLDAWRYRKDQPMATLAEAINNRLTADAAGGGVEQAERNNAHRWPGLNDLDKAVDRARTDPAYLDSLAPHERAAVRQRMANLDQRAASKGADQ